MKRLLLAVILASTFVGSMPAMELSKKVLLSLYDANKKTDFLLPKLIGSYALSYSLTYAHELGHALTNKLLLGGTNKIYISPVLQEAYTDSEVNLTTSARFDEHGSIIVEKIDVTTPIYKGSLTPESLNKIRAIRTLFGPVAGIAADVLTLKFHDILIECSRNSSNTLLETCLKGLQKPLFNSNQSYLILIPVLWSLWGNIRSLVEFERDDSDISIALKYLQINNPKDSYPKVSKIIQFLAQTWPALPIGIAIGNKVVKLIERK